MKKKTIIWMVFIVYMLILTKLIWIRYPLNIMTELIEYSSSSSLFLRLSYGNLIPLKTIIFYIFADVNFNAKLINILGNIVVFIPFGSMFQALRYHNTKLSTITIGFLLSLTYEIGQLITGVGAFDVDDLILNTLGVYLGVVIYKKIINMKKGRVLKWIKH